MSPETTRCSTAFRERGEPMLGSAPIVRRWLVIQHPGPWWRDNLETPGIARASAEVITPPWLLT